MRQSHNKISAQRVRQIVNEEINLYRRHSLNENSLTVDKIKDVVDALGKLQLGLMDFGEKTKDTNPHLASQFTDLIEKLEEKIQMVLKNPGDYISKDLDLPLENPEGEPVKKNLEKPRLSNPQVGSMPPKKQLRVEPTIKG